MVAISSIVLIKSLSIKPDSDMNRVFMKMIRSKNNIPIFDVMIK